MHVTITTGFLDASNFSWSFMGLHVYLQLLAYIIIVDIQIFLWKSLALYCTRLTCTSDLTHVFNVMIT